MTIPATHEAGDTEPTIPTLGDSLPHLPIVEDETAAESSKPRRRTAHGSVRYREIRSLTVDPRTMWDLPSADLSDIDPALLPKRPRTRAECANVPRPCPFVGCSNHLFLDVTKGGQIILNFPDLQPDQLEHSCALDIAEQDGATLDDVGRMLNVTRERIRQIEAKALGKLRAKSEKITGGLEGALRDAYALGERLGKASCSSAFSILKPRHGADPEEPEEEHRGRGRERIEPEGIPATINALGIVVRSGGAMPETLLPKRESEESRGRAHILGAHDLDRGDDGRRADRVSPPLGAREAGQGSEVAETIPPNRETTGPIAETVEPKPTPPAGPCVHETAPSVQEMPASVHEAREERSMSPLPKCSVEGCPSHVKPPKSGVELPGADMTKCMHHRAEAMGMKRWDYCKAIKKRQQELKAGKRKKTKRDDVVVHGPPLELKLPTTTAIEPAPVGGFDLVRIRAELADIGASLELAEEAVRLVEVIGIDTVRALAAKIGGKG